MKRALGIRPLYQGLFDFIQHFQSNTDPRRRRRRMAPPDSPHVDLVIVFNASSKGYSKQELRENAGAAEAEYLRLLSLLKDSGLKATGRRGEKTGQLLIFVWSPAPKLAHLVYRERHSDFLRGLPASKLPSIARDSSISSISPADRLRLIYEYVTSTRFDGGLGVVPNSKDWSRVESVMALHDHDFNDSWIRLWTRRQIGFAIGAMELDRLKDQFGESIALYFSFLSSYTYSLLVFALIGLTFFALKLPYSGIYSGILMFWSVGFVEYWRLRERLLSIRWGTRGSFRVERRRAQYEDVVGGGPFPWWKRDLRILASVPIILLFAAILGFLLTAIFVFEAFVTRLYTGPGHQYIAFSPTVIFVALVPRVLAIYRKYAVQLTQWENHFHQSSYDASLTIKSFALSAVVAYLGISLSAFVYVPFGEYLITSVQRGILTNQIVLFGALSSTIDKTGAQTNFDERKMTHSIWESNANSARGKLNPSRLQDQMFAYTVTSQAIGLFMEIGLPFILKQIDVIRHGKPLNNNSGKKKRVVFEDEKRGAKEEREFVARVRKEVALPQYELFTDYQEMATQFGYVALWSTIWPLASVMALLNNWLELRSDAFKISHHVRRPIPARTDTIGPWLDSLGFLTWLAALTNSSLVYLFRQQNNSAVLGTVIDTSHSYTSLTLNSTFITSTATPMTYDQLIIPAVLISLLSSHGYFLLRWFVRHILERLMWKGSKEEQQAERMEKEVKEQYLQSLGIDSWDVQDNKSNENNFEDFEHYDGTGFWSRDEGIDEIQKTIKEA